MDDSDYVCQSCDNVRTGNCKIKGRYEIAIITIYRAADSAIKKVRMWFTDAFGFTPCESDIVRYCLYTTHHVDRELQITLSRYRNFPGIKLRSVKVNNDVALRLRSFHKAHRHALAPNITAFATALVLFRANTLPKIGDKGMTLATPGKQIKSDKDRYITRFQGDNSP